MEKGKEGEREGEKVKEGGREGEIERGRRKKKKKNEKRRVWSFYLFRHLPFPPHEDEGVILTLRMELVLPLYTKIDASLSLYFPRKKSSWS